MFTWNIMQLMFAGNIVQLMFTGNIVQLMFAGNIVQLMFAGNIVQLMFAGNIVQLTSFSISCTACGLPYKKINNSARKLHRLLKSEILARSLLGGGSVRKS